MNLFRVLGAVLGVILGLGVAGWMFSGESLVTIAALTRNPVFVKAAVAVWDPNDVSSEQLPPLVVASHSGHRRILSILLDAGADPNLTGGDGRTALVYAVVADHPFLVRKLIAAGTDLNRKDREGLSALAHAAQRGRDGMSRDLLQNGAEGDSEDKRGNPALYYSIVTGNHGITRALVEAGADMNRVNSRGNTPLMEAWSTWENEKPIAQSLQRAAIGYLLLKGQRLTTRGSDGRSLGEVLAESKFADLIPGELVIPG
jgi:ankyrin repeat protein